MKRLFVLLVLGAGAAGCNILEYPVYVLFGQTRTTVKAEYEGLEGKKVAIIVAGKPGIDFEHPTARMDVALSAAEAIGRHVKKVSFVEQERIDRFQREAFDWYALPIDEMGRKFEAQQVLYLELLQFTVVEMDSVNLLRGRIWVYARIYDMEGPRPNEAVYQTEISVVFPEQAPVAIGEGARLAIWQRTLSLFAEELARKFYKHKREDG